ncbi:MAG: hypothetical protein K9K66_09245 [Desulfarculaceae bacterium]|nr:hypothetical protein [Desulfarculaceae bacterium]MCF8073083.1 hypothetical protein [Desulfarculaceae bacterium]MCF8101832.1 hypothetical protein [Desulfarculaceae bacterium]MCF8115359.1 hypothetical protein [Desulfarculaceae bacterium]
MSNDHNVKINYGVGFELLKGGIEEVEKYIETIPSTVEKQLESVWKVTKGEFSEFVQGTAEEANKTWSETTKEMKSLTGKAMGGSLTAWFDDDMDGGEKIRPQENPGALSLSMAV